jgi:hypothetical protein
VCIAPVGAGLNGHYPENIHLLPFLRTLCIVANNVTGMLPDVSSKYLSSLEVSANNLSGTIPTSFSHDSRLLHSIFLDSNRIEDIDYDSI